MKIHFLFFVAYVALVLCVIIYVIRLLVRMTKAQEESARHLYEVAKDIKAIALMKSDRKE